MQQPTELINEGATILAKCIQELKDSKAHEELDMSYIIEDLELALEKILGIKCST